MRRFAIGCVLLAFIAFSSWTCWMLMSHQYELVRFLNNDMAMHRLFAVVIHDLILIGSVAGVPLFSCLFAWYLWAHFRFSKKTDEERDSSGKT